MICGEETCAEKRNGSTLVMRCRPRRRRRLSGLGGGHAELGRVRLTSMSLQVALGKTWDVLPRAVRGLGQPKPLFVMAITAAARPRR